MFIKNQLSQLASCDAEGQAKRVQAISLALFTGVTAVALAMIFLNGSSFTAAGTYLMQGGYKVIAPLVAFAILSAASFIAFTYLARKKPSIEEELITVSVERPVLAERNIVAVEVEIKLPEQKPDSEQVRELSVDLAQQQLPAVEENKAVLSVQPQPQISAAAVVKKQAVAGPTMTPKALVTPAISFVCDSLGALLGALAAKSLKDRGEREKIESNCQEQEAKLRKKYKGDLLQQELQKLQKETSVKIAELDRDEQKSAVKAAKNITEVIASIRADLEEKYPLFVLLMAASMGVPKPSRKALRSLRKPENQSLAHLVQVMKTCKGEDSLQNFVADFYRTVLEKMEVSEKDLKALYKELNLSSDTTGDVFQRWFSEEMWPRMIAKCPVEERNGLEVIKEGLSGRLSAHFNPENKPSLKGMIQKIESEIHFVIYYDRCVEKLKTLDQEMDVEGRTKIFEELSGYSIKGWFTRRVLPRIISDQNEIRIFINQLNKYGLADEIQVRALSDPKNQTFAYLAEIVEKAKPELLITYSKCKAILEDLDRTMSPADQESLFEGLDFPNPERFTKWFSKHVVPLCCSSVEAKEIKKPVDQLINAGLLFKALLPPIFKVSTKFEESFFEDKSLTGLAKVVQGFKTEGTAPHEAFLFDFCSDLLTKVAKKMDTEEGRQKQADAYKYLDREAVLGKQSLQSFLSWFHTHICPLIFSALTREEIDQISQQLALPIKLLLEAGPPFFSEGMRAIKTLYFDLAGVEMQLKDEPSKRIFLNNALKDGKVFVSFLNPSNFKEEFSKIRSLGDLTNFVETLKKGRTTPHEAILLDALSMLLNAAASKRNDQEEVDFNRGTFLEIWALISSVFDETLVANVVEQLEKNHSLKKVVEAVVVLSSKSKSEHNQRQFLEDNFRQIPLFLSLLSPSKDFEKRLLKEKSLTGLAEFVQSFKKNETPHENILLDYFSAILTAAAKIEGREKQEKAFEDFDNKRFAKEGFNFFLEWFDSSIYAKLIKPHMDKVMPGVLDECVKQHSLEKWVEESLFLSIKDMGRKGVLEIPGAILTVIHRTPKIAVSIAVAGIMAAIRPFLGLIPKEVPRFMVDILRKHLGSVIGALWPIAKELPERQGGDIANFTLLLIDQFSELGRQFDTKPPQSLQEILGAFLKTLGTTHTQLLQCH